MSKSNSLSSSLIEQTKADPYHLTSEEYFNYDAGHPILDSIADGVFTVDQNYRITSFKLKFSRTTIKLFYDISL